MIIISKNGLVWCIIEILLNNSRNALNLKAMSPTGGVFCLSKTYLSKYKIYLIYYKYKFFLLFSVVMSKKELYVY
jgi:hypothetical protein